MNIISVAFFMLTPSYFYFTCVLPVGKKAKNENSDEQIGGHSLVHECTLGLIPIFLLLKLIAEKCGDISPLAKS